MLEPQTTLFWLFQLDDSKPFTFEMVGKSPFPTIKELIGLGVPGFYVCMHKDESWLVLTKSLHHENFQGCLFGAILSLFAIAKPQQVPKVPQGQLGGSSQLVSHGDRKSPK